MVQILGRTAISFAYGASLNHNEFVSQKAEGSRCPCKHALWFVELLLSLHQIVLLKDVKAPNKRFRLCLYRITESDGIIRN